MDPARPHTAVLNVQIEVHALDDIGQCSGQTLSTQSLEQADIQPSLILSVSGITAEDCLNKLKSKLEQFNEQSE